jgi:AcrR family transcriptional regulator
LKSTENVTSPGDASQNRPTRERIKAIAEDLHVLRGHDGFSFGDIAEAVGTTRANIHHHFGNKRRLMGELIDGFVTDAEVRIAQHWTGGDVAFRERFQRQLDDLRRFYVRFNPREGDRNVWSPVSRIRLDLPVLGDVAVAALERVNVVYERSLREAIADAVRDGDLPDGTPVDALTQILRVTFLSCGPVTQDTGSFAEIERLFEALGAALFDRHPSGR